MNSKEILKEEIIKKAVVHGKVILSSGKEADYANRLNALIVREHQAEEILSQAAALGRLGRPA